MESIKNYTSDYNEVFKEKIPHLRHYDNLTPFVGKKWNSSKYKIFIIAESHYINKKDYPDNPNELIANWYDNPNMDFYNRIKGNLNTKEIINKSEVGRKAKYEKPLINFYRMKKLIEKTFDELKLTDSVFENFVLFNYFQRPAFKSGDSINLNIKDREIAYVTLLKFVEILEPQYIIFNSSKSYDNFILEYKKNKSSVFDKVKIYLTPHAGMPWWFKKSKRYNNLTGEKRFIEILQKINESV
jgi:hypothetical protein